MELCRLLLRSDDPRNRPSDVRMTRRANGTDLKLATPTTALHGELEARWKEIPGFDCKKPGLSSFFCLSLYSKLKKSTVLELHWPRLLTGKAPSVSSEERRQIYQTARLVCPSGLATERPLPTATPLDAFPGANSLRRVRPRQSCPGSVRTIIFTSLRPAASLCTRSQPRHPSLI